MRGRSRFAGKLLETMTEQECHECYNDDQTASEQGYCELPTMIEESMNHGELNPDPEGPLTSNPAGSKLCPAAPIIAKPAGFLTPNPAGSTTNPAGSLILSPERPCAETLNHVQTASPLQNWQTLSSLRSGTGSEDARSNMQGPENQDVLLNMNHTQHVEGPRLVHKNNRYHRTENNHYNICENTRKQKTQILVVLPRIVVLSEGFEPDTWKIEQIAHPVDPNRWLPARTGVVPQILLTDVDTKTVYHVRSWPDRACEPQRHDGRTPQIDETDYDTRTVTSMRTAPLEHEVVPPFWGNARTPVIFVHSVTGAIERRQDPRDSFRYPGAPM